MSAAATNPAPMPILVRLPNWVGDVCMALPAIHRLTAAGFAPQVVGKAWAVDLLAGMSWPVHALPKDRPIAALRAIVREHQITAGLLLPNSVGSAWQLARAGVRAVGYAKGGDRWLRRWLLKRAVSAEVLASSAHEVTSFWHLAGVAAEVYGRVEHAPALPTQLGLTLHARHHDQARFALTAAGVTGAYVVLCPLATGLIGGHSKCWPSFPLVCRMLTDAGVTAVAVPGPGEEAASANALPGARQLPGLRLGAYAAVLAGARLALANDSGPMHLAAAVGVPVVGVFGVSDPSRTRPWGERAVAVGSATVWPTLGEVLAAMTGLGFAP